MGYRSNVKIIMKKRDYERLKSELARLNEETAYNKDILDYAEKKETPQDGIILTWNYIKWDEDTDEAIEYIMNYLSESGDPHRYIRIGEGYGTDTDIDDYDHYADMEDLDFINQIGWKIEFTEHILEK